MKKINYFSFIIALAFAISACNSQLNPSLNEITRELQTKNGNNKLYLRQITWGLTGDKSQVIISSNSSWKGEVNPKEDYVYDGTYFCYKLESDTLHVYVPLASPKPSLFKSDIIVMQHVLDNPSMMEICATSKEKGIENFSLGSVTK